MQQINAQSLDKNLQKDSLRKNHISFNIAAGLISGEVGLYFDHRISDKFGFQLSYGHRFYNFNLVKNGGSGFGILYFPQTSDIIRVGVKKYLKSNNITNQNKYFIYRISAWNLHTPKYTTREDGSNGLSLIKRSVISVDKNVLNFALGIGKEINKKYLYVDLFASLAVSAGLKKTHIYSSGYGGSATNEYYNNKFIKTFAFFPTIEFGCKIGF